ncbi:reverse transcriptase domain-containing protein [Tanacetum coccineum]
MEDTRIMSKLLQAPIEGYRDAVVIPTILAKTFELKVRLLTLVTSSQFHGFERDDPHSYIRWFNNITSTLKYKNVPHEAIKLMLFPFSLKGAARIWLEKEPPHSIHTWEDLVSNEAWDRFKNLLRKCPHHGFSELHQIDTFYNALTQSDQDSLNAVAGGNLLNCTPRDALTIIENKSKVCTSRNKPVVSKASATTSSTPTYLPEITALTDVVKAMLLQNKTPSPASIKAIEETYVICGVSHPYYECLATDGNTFNASTATGTYNQGGHEYRPQGETNYRASNQMIPPGFPQPNKKEKLFELANTPLNENCSAVLLNKLPEKLGDPGKFLIPCDFPELEECLELADLGASINLMPLFVWKKFSLSKLTPTRMTLELANRSVAYPVGVAEDVFVKVGKFTFLADFVVVNYDVDPHVPLILGRPFLRTARALVDVYGEELILRDSDEKLIFHADSTSKHPQKHRNESINMINFIDITCDDRFEEELKIKKSKHPISGSTTSLSDSSPSLIPFETSDFLLEEFADELALLDLFPSGNKEDNYDPEADLREIKYLLNRDSSTDYSLKVDIDSINPVLKRFVDEPAIIYSSPPGDDDDDLFDFKTDNKEWKKFLYGDLFNNFDLKNEKNKDLKMECLIDNMNDEFFFLFDSTLPEESSEVSEIVTLPSFPFGNEDKVFNPGILSLGKTQIFYDNSKDKDLKVDSSTEALLILEENNISSYSSNHFYDHELLFFLELTVIETLLSFSPKNKDKVFNLGILTLNGVHSFTLGLSHWTFETFKIINVHPNILNEGPMKIFPIAPDYEDSRARGFVHRSLEF